MHLSNAQLRVGVLDGLQARLQFLELRHLLEAHARRGECAQGPQRGRQAAPSYFPRTCVSHRMNGPPPHIRAPRSPPLLPSVHVLEQFVDFTTVNTLFTSFKGASGPRINRTSKGPRNGRFGRGWGEGVRLTGCSAHRRRRRRVRGALAVS
jgi:hypothetical protein